LKRVQIHLTAPSKAIYDEVSPIERRENHESPEAGRRRFWSSDEGKAAPMGSQAGSPGHLHPEGFGLYRMKIHWQITRRCSAREIGLPRVTPVDDAGFAAVQHSLGFLVDTKNGTPKKIA
jgi:hypothetical protein